MNTRQTLRVIPPLLALALPSCGRDEAPSTTPNVAHETAPPRERSAPPPPTLPDSSMRWSRPQTMTIVVKVPFGSAHSTPEEVEAFIKAVKNPNLGEVVRHVRTMTAKRTPEGMKAMMELLRDYESKLPKEPPSKEEFMTASDALNADITALGQDHFFVCFMKAQKVATELICFDVPEASEAAEGYRNRIRQKWQGGGEVDAYLKAMDSEFKHAYADVKQGIMPWQERKFSP